MQCISCHGHLWKHVFKNPSSLSVKWWKAAEVKLFIFSFSYCPSCLFSSTMFLSHVDSKYVKCFIILLHFQIQSIYIAPCSPVFFLSEVLNKLGGIMEALLDFHTKSSWKPDASPPRLDVECQTFESKVCLCGALYRNHFDTAAPAAVTECVLGKPWMQDWEGLPAQCINHEKKPRLCLLMDPWGKLMRGEFN